MSRTKRKEYTKSKRFDASCRCHGGCSWCAKNRLYQDIRDRDAADKELSFYERTKNTDDHYLDHPGWW